MILCLLLCLLATSARAATLTATLDRTDIAEGESVTLTVEAVDADGDIDFSVLDADFDVLNVSRSRNVRIMNGRSDSSLTFEVALLPKRTGEISIPAFSLDGARSQPITLQVGEAPAQTPGVAAGREFFVETSVDKTTPYVQEQVIVSVKIYQAREIVEGRLDDPASDQLVVQRLGNDVSYQSELQGQRYTVIERRFAVFAQESGVVRLPPIALTATVRRTDRWRGGSFFAPTENIRVASNALQLDVKPRPAGHDAGWWLPADAFGLTENWSTDPTAARVGEPLTRTISLSAVGVQENQLPVLRPPEVEGVKIYPDQPELQTVADSEGLQSYRTDKWAIIPQRAGEVTLPEVRVNWFDTARKESREAVLPATTITVAASPGAVPEVPNPVEQPVATTEPAPTSDVGVEAPLLPTAASRDPGLWPWATLLALLGWVATGGLWWRSRRRPGAAMPERALSTRAKRRADLSALRSAVAGGDARAFRRALLTWSAQHWPTSSPAGLQALAQRLRSAELEASFKALDAAVYGSGQTVDLHAVLRSVEQALAAEKEMGSSPGTLSAALPQL